MILCSGLFWILRLLHLFLEWCSVKALCLFVLVLWYIFLIRLVLMFRKQDLNNRLFLVLVKFEFFLQKNKMWCGQLNTVKTESKVVQAKIIRPPRSWTTQGTKSRQFPERGGLFLEVEQVALQILEILGSDFLMQLLPSGGGPYSKFPLYKQCLCENGPPYLLTTLTLQFFSLFRDTN